MFIVLGLELNIYALRFVLPKLLSAVSRLTLLGTFQVRTYMRLNMRTNNLFSLQCVFVLRSRSQCVERVNLVDVNGWRWRPTDATHTHTRTASAPYLMFVELFRIFAFCFTPRVSNYLTMLRLL